MKQMKLLVVIALIVSRLSAAEIEARAIHETRVPALAIREDAAPASIQEANESFRNFTICLYLKNIGQDVIRVPTEPYGLTNGYFGYYSKSSPETFIIPIRWEFPENPLGLKAIIAESKLGIVSLKPGETTIVEIQIHIDPKKCAKLNLIYEVERDFAKQYNIWSGSLLVASEKH